MLELYTIVAQTEPSSQLLATRVILALVCVIVSSSLALGVCVGLVRRIQVISPVRPEPQPQDEAQDTSDQRAS